MRVEWLRRDKYVYRDAQLEKSLWEKNFFIKKFWTQHFFYEIKKCVLSLEIFIFV